MTVPGARTCATLLAAVAAMVFTAPVRAQTVDQFDKFVAALWPEAQAAGVSRPTFDRAFKGVTPDLSLPDLEIPGKPRSATIGQAEFVRPPQDYINRDQLARLATAGKSFMAQHQASLVRIEQAIGVERHVVMGIWGRETAYGTAKLPHYAIRVLATQAWVGRRKDMFRAELLAGLKLLQDGTITVEAMRSSWAGAMGLPQFMPSEIAQWAVDIDGDGRKNIWTSVPDALGSAANQLKGKGWTPGLPWGFEVTLAPGADCALEGPGDGRPLADWTRLGVKRANGQPFPEQHLSQPAYLMAPGGTHGPVFLVTENFKVIRAYNTSDLYAVFVGNLADRIAGGGDFATPWRGIVQLPTREIEETQERLKTQGFDIDRIDGKIGSNTRKQIGLYQRKAGLPVDCWPSQATLARLRTSTAAAR